MKKCMYLLCLPLLLIFFPIHAQETTNTPSDQQEQHQPQNPLSVQRLMHYLVDSAYLTPQGAIEGQSLSFIANSGGSKGFPSPLSYAVAPEYFGAYVCETDGNSCHVTNYRSSDYSILGGEDQGFALQVERMNMTHGTVIYDAAAWQIAVALHGQRLGAAKGEAYMAAAEAQTHYLIQGAFSDDQASFTHQNRAVTNNQSPVYQGTAIPKKKAERAYTFRMVPKAWALLDPFAMSANKTFLERYVSVTGENITSGQITWLDWKGITGENAWAHFIGPLQTEYLNYTMQHPEADLEEVQFSTATLSNAVNVLHAVALLQSKVGAIYYAPSGSVGNTGAPVNPYEVSIENNASMLGGLLLLEKALSIHEQQAQTEGEMGYFSKGLKLVREVLYGRTSESGPYKQTKGLIDFFVHTAWDAENVRFYTHGMAYPDGSWKVPSHTVNAVDANSWVVAILGAKFLDEHLGAGTTYQIWVHLRPWGGYFDHHQNLLGVGFDDSNQGKGQTIMSAEWTLGAIGMLRTIQEYYQDPEILAAVSKDIASMRQGLLHLTTDAYSRSEVFAEDVPQSLSSDFASLSYEQMVFPKISEQSQGLLYASKRYFIPFGWYANPVPSTASTAWAVMDQYGYNPFTFGGHYKGVE